MTHLRRNDVIVGLDAQFIEDSRQHLLGFAVAINVRVIEVIYTSIDSFLDGGSNFGFIDIGPAVRVSVYPVEATHGPTPQTHF